MGQDWIVNCHNEWDPLEEVIIGELEGKVVAPDELAVQAVFPPQEREADRARRAKEGGKLVDTPEFHEAKKELANFIHVLEQEGVTVRRADPIKHDRPFSTPDWTSPAGLGQACPRDLLIVFGNELLETTMTFRSRYFEFLSYRKLLKEYFRHGARWTAMPKPQMGSALFDEGYAQKNGWVTTEFEPVCEAADAARFGKDVFVQRSHATNTFGIEWLQRHLGEQYRVHEVVFEDPQAHHIDCTFMPLAPGKLMVNPGRPIKQMPAMFKKAGWDLLECPPSSFQPGTEEYTFYKWYHFNVLSLDEKRVIVEAHEENMIRALKKWGFTPIPVPFSHYYPYGGSVRCSTVDVRRRGTLKSYF